MVDCSVLDRSTRQESLVSAAFAREMSILSCLGCRIDIV